MQNGDRARIIETRFARVTGIEIKRPPNHFVEWQVRMAEHNHIRLVEFDAPTNGVGGAMHIDDVMHHEFFAGKLDDFGFLVIQFSIVVSQHRGHLRDVFQLKDDLRLADVACMEDVFDALEQRRDFRVQKIMRVGNDADFHALACSGCSCGSSSGASSASSSSSGSIASINFIAPAKSAVKSPLLVRVLRKNSHVCGQPAVPLVSATNQPASVLVYSGLWNGLNSHENVLVMR